MRFNYDVHEDYNLMMMPTRRALGTLHLRATRPVHDSGHATYNRFVYDGLNAVASFGDLLGLLAVLHRGCRGLFRIWKR